MIITLSGKAGSGKSTIAKGLAKALALKHYSVGDVMRQMAQDKGVSLIELNKQAETDPEIDKELDKRLIDLGKQEDNFVIDGRLTAHFIAHAAHRIFLDATPEIRAQRILGDKGTHRSGEDNQDLKQTMQNMEAREQSERKRYKEYYNADYLDPELYTIVLDTSELSIEAVLQTLLDKINACAP